MKDFLELVLKFIRFFFTSLLGLVISLNSQIFFLLKKKFTLFFVLIVSLIFSLYFILKTMIDI